MRIDASSEPVKTKLPTTTFCVTICTFVQVKQVKLSTVYRHAYDGVVVAIHHLQHTSYVSIRQQTSAYVPSTAMHTLASSRQYITECPCGF